MTLHIGGKTHLGYDQEWYPERWQKLAGCGPTTGAVIVSYLEARDRGIRADSEEKALAQMLRLWPYATPRIHGLYKTRWLAEGLGQYMKDHGLRGSVEMLSVPPIRILRPGLDKTAGFIREGLLADAPIGFLNLHNGGNEAMYSWHWMPLTALSEEGGRCTGTAWDEGKALSFDLGAWLADTKFGGGFVRVLKNRPAAKI